MLSKADERFLHRLGANEFVHEDTGRMHFCTVLPLFNVDSQVLKRNFCNGPDRVSADVLERLTGPNVSFLWWVPIPMNWTFGCSSDRVDEFQPR